MFYRPQTRGVSLANLFLVVREPSEEEVEKFALNDARAQDGRSVMVSRLPEVFRK